MAFRIVTTPLRRRTENEAIENELIVDNVQGDLGISVNEEYISGSEENKSDFETLKIRSEIINNELNKLNFGSENNAISKGFNIEKALIDGDILGAMKYLLDQYDNYVKEDENGNITFDNESIDYKSKIKNILDTLYSKNSNSYSYKFRQILVSALEMEAENNNENETNEKDINNSKIRRDINLNLLPSVLKLEREIEELEHMEKSLNEMISSFSQDGNIFKSLNKIEEDINYCNYEIKKRKFIRYKHDETIRQNYQTENELDSSSFKFNNNYNLLKKESNFENNSYLHDFLASPFDNNFDGSNLYFELFNQNQSENFNDSSAIKRSYYSIESNIKNHFSLLPINKDNFINNYISVYDSYYDNISSKIFQSDYNLWNEVYFDKRFNFKNGIINNISNLNILNPTANYYSSYGNPDNSYLVDNNFYLNKFNEFQSNIIINLDNGVLKAKDIFNGNINTTKRFGFDFKNEVYLRYYDGYEPEITTNNYLIEEYGKTFRRQYAGLISIVDSIFNNLNDIEFPEVGNADFIYNITNNNYLYTHILMNFSNNIFKFAFLDNNSFTSRNDVELYDLNNNIINNKNYSENLIYTSDGINNRFNFKINNVNISIDYKKKVNTLSSILKEIFNNSKDLTSDDIIITTNFEDIKNNPIFYDDLNMFLENNEEG